MVVMALTPFGASNWDLQGVIANVSLVTAGWKQW